MGEACDFVVSTVVQIGVVVKLSSAAPARLRNAVYWGRAVEEISGVSGRGCGDPATHLLGSSVTVVLTEDKYTQSAHT